ncbi:MAG TPA: Stp1/IreP family PP2C-type Ser/Thr phosphatase [Solirubrobacteraceae bacterium]|nr:Stp1/IreP family PP2C-type Ser/Thr phosphatase [Solirubrobacteraceae bacterium]
MLRVAEHWSGSDTGLQRRANEDSLLVRSPLFIVADGMGGAQAGEVASRVAVETFSTGLEAGADPQESLARQVQEANTRINDLSHQRSEHAGMGTTITAIYVGEQEVAIAHVGDSRAYCLRGEELLRLTDDHSLVDELIKQGKLTPEEAEDHPQRSVITRALGPEPAVEVDVRSFRARPGDVYLICSDGLTTMVGEEQLGELLSSHEQLRDAGEALIAAANAAGGKDNITVVLLRLEEVSPGSPGGRDGHPALTELTPATSEHMPAEEVAEQAVVATLSSAATTTGAAVTARVPRRPSPSAAPTDKGRLRRSGRRIRAPLIALVVLAALAAGAYLALQSVYFIATNQRGLVTVFRGVPYELPGGIKLYSSDYVSGVSAATLSPQRRDALLDHSLRSEGDAATLVRQLELGQLSGG